MQSYKLKDVFDMETIANFNTTLWWESVSHRGLPDRQAVATLLESIVAIAFEMGILALLITIITASYTMQKWQTRRFKFYY